jgi:hypothetical protein
MCPQSWDAASWSSISGTMRIEGVLWRTNMSFDDFFDHWVVAVLLLALVLFGWLMDMIQGTI